MSNALGFRFTGKGIFDRIDTFTTKHNKGIVSIILDVPDDKYPQKVTIKLFGKLADMGRACSKGEVVEIVGRAGGRDWNGKVYDELIAESLEVVDEPAQGSLPVAENDDKGSLPF